MSTPFQPGLYVRQNVIPPTMGSESIILIWLLIEVRPQLTKSLEVPGRIRG